MNNARGLGALGNGLTTFRNPSILKTAHGPQTALTVHRHIRGAALMKRLFAIALFGTLLCCCPPLRAEDVPHLDFVRGLREKRYPDLALEYLKKLSQNPPAD